MDWAYEIGQEIFMSSRSKYSNGQDAHVCISYMYNCALQHGMPHDWSMNHIKLLHKRGDINILMYNGSEAKSMGKKELQEDFSGKKTKKELQEENAQVFVNTMSSTIIVLLFKC